MVRCRGPAFSIESRVSTTRSTRSVSPPKVGWETETLRVGGRAEMLDDERPALLRLRSSRVFVAERRLDSTTLRRAIDPSMSLSQDFRPALVPSARRRFLDGFGSLGPDHHAPGTRIEDDHAFSSLNDERGRDTLSFFRRPRRI